jgi:hypothetical protein
LPHYGEALHAVVTIFKRQNPHILHRRV